MQVLPSDTQADVDKIANKILKLKLFADDQDKHWQLDVTQKNFEVLIGTLIISMK